MFIDDFLRRPAVELEKMLTFSGYKAARQDILTAVADSLPSLLRELRLSNASDCPSALSAGLQVAVAESIGNEMKLSKELTKWPCRSFKDLEASSGGALPLRFHALSANCTGSHVKCSVQYDMNEQRV